MKQLSEIFYDALQADEGVMSATGGRIVSTCFEVSPDEDDNTPLPNIIITNDGFQNNTSTKDCIWESDEDTVQATVDIAACSPEEVDKLVAKVRKAIETYICAMYTIGKDVPELLPGFPSSQGVEWDWMRPCYYQKVTYHCVVNKYIDDEQED